ncbi:MAG: hypothetical protein A2Y25_00925 [Candidatus Melainabacteria bacterium GWF2_37_15]|nr:MAG: hypothetical protein A2Y25_00925 [Candidatus Melainabacteria bacterium GWF2_37_15]
MKKYLAFVVLGLMLVLVQPAFSQCGIGGCPVSMNPCDPCMTGAAYPVAPACPTCPPRLTYQPVYEPVAPVIQTVYEPVTTYQARQVASCPTACPTPCPVAVNPCDPCGAYGFTGAAAPMYGGMYYGGAAPIVYEEDEGFFSNLFSF